MHIADLQEEQYIEGIIPHQRVQILSVKPYGTSAKIVYECEDGSLGSMIASNKETATWIISRHRDHADFQADGTTFQLVSEAQRIKLAYLFDPFLAVHSSAIQPLPHQISAVYACMLPKHPLRYVLADDPGAGKTIMTGLLVKELIIRGDVKRCMIVSPGNLVEQWQDELYTKFGLHFELLTNDMLEGSASGNAFAEHPFLIARLDKLSRNEEVQKKINVCHWDIIVIDEAHKCSATVLGNKVSYTKRYWLAKHLSSRTRHFLLLTATPHNGNEASFQQFMALIDQDRFACHSNDIKTTSDVSDVMRRLVKEDLLKFDGTPLFPERKATTVPYTLSPEEQQLYEQVTDYVRQQFNLAEKLKGDKKNAVGFALTVLQRRLASSPEAIYQSLKRRRERLETMKKELAANPHATEDLPIPFDEDDYDDLPDDEMEEVDDEMADNATSAETLEELQKEIDTLRSLERQAEMVRNSGHDKKWDEVSSLMQSQAMWNKDGQREKIIIFTEHKDTLCYLARRIRTLLGNPEAVVTIMGGMKRDDRKHIEQLFKQDKETSVLVATDAAGEGVNLQRAHLMINYDLPWNPNRIEQRFGRIHRIGQTEICHLWNLVAKNTREGEVFQKLFDKLEAERQSLGGKVFDVLGKISFDDKPLKDILVEAIRYGNDPKNRQKLFQIVDTSLDTEHLIDLLKAHALTKEIMTIKDVNAIKEQMERMEARKLQPHYIQSFFAQAFALAGGSIHPREHNRLEITHVPFALINAHPEETRRKVLHSYERVCFDNADIEVEGKPVADLLSPGHPLLDALVDWMLDHYGLLLKQGTILIDPKNRTTVPRVMYELSLTVKDASGQDHKGRIINRRLHFVELSEKGAALQGGYAPYLDYLPLQDFQRMQAKDILESQHWIGDDAQEIATGYAITHIAPPFLEEVRQERLRHIEKTKHEVDARLIAEINYWDGKVADYQERLRKKGPNLGISKNLKDAKEYSEELASRRTIRLQELEQEKQISMTPPVMLGMAFVIPQAMMMAQIAKEQEPAYGVDRKTIELAAMDTVMELERKWGYQPVDVSAQNIGYDIESRVSDPDKEGYLLRCIEVKGRSVEHANTVCITRNEILSSLNCPERFFLAIVVVDGQKRMVTYCKPHFRDYFRATGPMIDVQFDVSDLLKDATILWQETLEEHE